jgi:hypothetical protein
MEAGTSRRSETSEGLVMECELKEVYASGGKRRAVAGSRGMARVFEQKRRAALHPSRRVG